ncbi:MAG: HD domain-containing protein [Bacteroidales bacterium]|nr:HD domain-containing protein [Bacteroidales bacterium]
MHSDTLYEKALQIARTAHAGQRDKAGADYILHPLRVAAGCRTAEAKVVALLHDTIEDTPVTADHLRQQGFPDEIVEAVLSVTRGEGEPYEQYILRAAQNPLGCEVKIADLEDNMDLRRLPKITTTDVARTAKYLKAWHYLCGRRRLQTPLDGRDGALHTEQQPLVQRAVDGRGGGGRPFTRRDEQGAAADGGRTDPACDRATETD